MHKHYSHEPFVTVIFVYTTLYMIITSCINTGSNDQVMYSLTLSIGICTLISSIILGLWELMVFDDTYIGRLLNYNRYIFTEENAKLGFILFIISEVLIFGGFFWALFYKMGVPTPDIGCVGPPINAPQIDVGNIPFVNTILLLVSGISVTWAHHLLEDIVVDKKVNKSV